MPEVRFEAKSETVAVLDAYCSATGGGAEMITLTKAENPRYTIWRALNPAGRNWDFMAWIRSEWAACRDCNRSKGARTPEQWRGA